MYTVVTMCISCVYMMKNENNVCTLSYNVKILYVYRTNNVLYIKFMCNGCKGKIKNDIKYM